MIFMFGKFWNVSFLAVQWCKKGSIVISWFIFEFETNLIFHFEMAWKLKYNKNIGAKNIIVDRDKEVIILGFRNMHSVTHKYQYA